ncbi:hypothetical protein M427DRAFT_56066 [Gonapodya prolifera JEL478]|uniref:Uncharacterized protein n=1 Tax=Gonapodya prolifera (strain JEL478) TaxID=1344416 RepID=A0A139AH88_GONPJ|nr:hypothetical protein M427DRAFT_56066 [Gonapodya prolifera JEL478]|eukprot:KXS16181.1 hypothetical protein M427DRAFT_56066 [Gonapodya prolifera JEL478]
MHDNEQRTKHGHGLQTRHGNAATRSASVRSFASSPGPGAGPAPHAHPFPSPPTSGHGFRSVSPTQKMK